ncbi:hypothetical protein BGZ63DRAFT_58614 [Mariannaea sp. PMI_226]|nr:hypothetical protein BGZ63DRAFT_58614 [Mariannaea sp. PMI_226]
MASVESVAGDRSDAMTCLQDPSSRELSTRLTPATIPAAIKFDIPTGCRDFAPFARLPAEIRHQIWGLSLSTPGMQFLKVQWEDQSQAGKWWTPGTSRAPSHVSSSDEDEKEQDPILLEAKTESRPTLTQMADLVPLFPTPRADISYYTTLNQELARLSVTCNESAAVVKRLMSRPSTLTLVGGRMISLDISADVVYLEYVPHDIFESGCRFSKKLVCPGLEKIRKVAFRYCHTWYEKHSPTRCSVCGQIHQQADRIAYPNHLYQFMAQYLPNLEQFYFVDYFILRKTEEEALSQAGSPPPKGVTDTQRHGKFEGGNRTYYEVNEQDWTVTSKVYHTMSWLQDRFVRYAKASTLATHKNPEQVKFRVLACEWSVGRSLEVKRAQTTPVKKGQNKRAFCEEHTTRRSRRSPKLSSVPADNRITLDLKGSIPFVFGVEGKNDYEFTFTVPRK